MARLAFLAEKKGNESQKRRIYEAGVLPTLLNYLCSQEEDRVEHSCLALSFLTEDVDIATDAFDAGAFVFLMSHGDHPKWQMRSVASKAVSNIFMTSVSFKADFAKIGGVEFLVDSLIISTHTTVSPEDEAELLDNAVLELQDFVQPEDAPVCIECATKVIEAGALQLLRGLTAHRDKDVQTSAAELLNTLQEACPNVEARARSFVVLTMKSATQLSEDGMTSLSFADTDGEFVAKLNLPTSSTALEVYKELADQIKLPKTRIKVLFMKGGLLPARTCPLEHYLPRLLQC
jgi:hypothetical protein